MEELTVSASAKFESVRGIYRTPFAGGGHFCLERIDRRTFDKGVQAMSKSADVKKDVKKKPTKTMKEKKAEKKAKKDSKGV